MLDSLHFREVPEHQGSFVVLAATREAAHEALRALPADSYITFYDASEPRGGGDPGTYFSMRRSGADWQITGGNHGWSHGVARITHEEAEKFLTFCLPSNRGPYPDCIGYAKDRFPRQWESEWSSAALSKRVRQITSNEEKG